jgi:heme A synthase
MVEIVNMKQNHIFLKTFILAFFLDCFLFVLDKSVYQRNFTLNTFSQIWLQQACVLVISTVFSIGLYRLFLRKKNLNFSAAFSYACLAIALAEGLFGALLRYGLGSQDIFLCSQNGSVGTQQQAWQIDNCSINGGNIIHPLFTYTVFTFIVLHVFYWSGIGLLTLVRKFRHHIDGA